MRRLARTVPLLVLLAVAGCATDPEARIMQARATLTEAQDAALVLHAAGAVSDEVLVDRIDPSVQVAREAIERARMRLPDEPGLIDWIEVAEAALLRLAAVRSDYVGGIDR